MAALTVSSTTTAYTPATSNRVVSSGCSTPAKTTTNTSGCSTVSTNPPKTTTTSSNAPSGNSTTTTSVNSGYKPTSACTTPGVVKSTSSYVAPTAGNVVKSSGCTTPATTGAPAKVSACTTPAQIAPSAKTSASEVEKNTVKSGCSTPSTTYVIPAKASGCSTPATTNGSTSASAAPAKTSSGTSAGNVKENGLDIVMPLVSSGASVAFAAPSFVVVGALATIGLSLLWPAETVNQGEDELLAKQKAGNSGGVSGTQGAENTNQGSEAGKIELPKNPDDLLNEGWKEVTDPRNTSGSRDFINPQTGEKVRFDPGKQGDNGWEGKDHYHRVNPDSTGKNDYYLDVNGNPVPRGSNSSHIPPK